MNAGKMLAFHFSGAFVSHPESRLSSNMQNNRQTFFNRNGVFMRPFLVFKQPLRVSAAAFFPRNGRIFNPQAKITLFFPI